MRDEYRLVTQRLLQLNLCAGLLRTPDPGAACAYFAAKRPSKAETGKGFREALVWQATFTGSCFTRSLAQLPPSLPHEPGALLVQAHNARRVHRQAALRGEGLHHGLRHERAHRRVVHHRHARRPRAADRAPVRACSPGAVWKRTCSSCNYAGDTDGPSGGGPVAAMRPCLRPVSGSGLQVHREHSVKNAAISALSAGCGRDLGSCLLHAPRA